MFRYRQRPCRRLLLLFGRGVILIALTNVLRRACGAKLFRVQIYVAQLRAEIGQDKSLAEIYSL